MDTRSIASDWTIERILSEHPATIPVLLAHQLACVGCSMARFCTLEDAMMIYHLPHDRLLQDLQQASGNARTTADQAND